MLDSLRGLLAAANDRTQGWLKRLALLWLVTLPFKIAALAALLFSGSLVGGLWYYGSRVVTLPPHLQAPLVVVLAVATMALARFVLHRPFIQRRVQRSISRFSDIFLASPEQFGSRLLMAVLVATAGIAALGIAALFATNVHIQTSSAPVLLTTFEIATNLWVYLAAFLVVNRQLLFFNDRQRARNAASQTAYSYQTVRRWAEEAKTPDISECTRIIAETGDGVEQLQEWIHTALVTGAGHDNPGWGGDQDGVEEREPPGLPPGDPQPAPNTPAGPDPDDEEQLPAELRLRLFWNDLGATLEADLLIWRFLLPTIVAFLVQLALVEIWVVWWVYPIMIAVAVFAGAFFYWIQLQRQQRRLSKLRTDRGGDRWTDANLLLKKVDTAEKPMYYGYMAGKTYASPDPVSLSWTLAHRADELVNQGASVPSPAIEERNAWLLRRYLPQFDAWIHEVAKSRIMDELIDVVKDAPERIVPREALATMVIEHDRRHILWGAMHVGLGYDPELVAEVYQDLVDCHALVEHEVTLVDDEGTERELVAVSAGDEPMHGNVPQLRAEFSPWFSPAKQYRYDLPSGEPFLDLQPVISTE